jgi:hypothetical protein
MVAPIVKMPNTEKHSGVSGIPTQLLVLHSAECPLRGGYAQSLTNWANVPLAQGGPEASWHWFPDPIAIVSMVDPNFAAWHASEANPMSEGFEQAGYARYSRAEWTTPEGMKQMDNLAWIWAQRAKANGIPAVWLTTAQVNAITSGRDLVTKGFCTHRQIDPETRTDPGDGYPFDLLTARIKAYMGGAAVGTQGTTRKGIFMSLTPKEEQEILAAARKVNRYLDAPTGAIPEKVTAAILDEPVTRAAVGGNTSLRSTIAYLDKNLNSIRDDVAGKKSV